MIIIDFLVALIFGLAGLIVMLALLLLVLSGTETGEAIDEKIAKLLRGANDETD